MVFIETPIFERLVRATLTDEDYGALQQALADHPDCGAVVKGGKGIRKMRWALSGGGKSGGIRVMYYWRVREDQILLIYLFPKSERTDLTPAEVKRLAKYVEEQLR